MARAYVSGARLIIVDLLVEQREGYFDMLSRMLSRLSPAKNRLLRLRTISINIGEDSQPPITPMNVFEADRS